MDFIANFLQQGLDYIIPFVILLGILIFVHELGHFLVAKFYGVRVEVFSLGFGKKVFQFRRGDTVYCISLIPLGGYVKMFGDDPSAEVAEDQKRYAFLHKPVLPRIAIVLAGPLMNFFFAIVVFTGVAFLGERALAPKIGDVEKDTAAYKIGFRSGDKVLSVNGQGVFRWKDFTLSLQDRAGQQTSIEVLRNDGKTKEQLTAIPTLGPNENVLSFKDHVGQIEGTSFLSRAPFVGVSDPTSQAAVTGLQTGDQILSLQGTEILYWRQLESEVLKHLKEEKLIFKVKREVSEDKYEEKEFKLVVPGDLNSRTGLQALSALGIEKTDLFLAKVVSGSPAEEQGLRRGDKIVSIGETRLNRWNDLVAAVKSYKADQPPLDITVLREGLEQKFRIKPKMTSLQTQNGAQEDRYTIGIQPWIIQTPPETVVAKISNPLKAVWFGIAKSWEWSEMTVLTFVRIFQNKISPKNIGGVVSIAVVAKKTFEIGISEFLTIMGIISINLFILNLLPIPVLDGGHLVFFSIEALRGAPISLRKLEIAQQVGLFVILMLIAFALINDFSRYLSF